MQNRRTKEGYKLRVYMDAIKEARAMSEDQWIQNFTQHDGPYFSRISWISYLEKCALQEAEKIAQMEAA